MPPVYVLLPPLNLMFLLDILFLGVLLSMRLSTQIIIKWQNAKFIHVNHIWCVKDWWNTVLFQGLVSVLSLPITFQMVTQGEVELHV